MLTYLCFTRKSIDSKQVNVVFHVRRLTRHQHQKTQIHNSTCHSNCRLIHSLLLSLSSFHTLHNSNLTFSIRTIWKFWCFNSKLIFFGTPFSASTPHHSNENSDYGRCKRITFNVLIVSPQNVKLDFKIRNFPIELHLIWSGLPIESSSQSLRVEVTFSIFVRGGNFIL